jgi:Ni/Co efflux regulator RcnB
MKKQLGAIVFCSAMLVSSPVLLAQDGDHGAPPPGHYHGLYDQGQHEGWYRRGGHVPPAYRTARYVVSDWHRYHLKAPPRGYHYIRSDNGDFLLAAITTGTILSIVAASH